MAGKTQVFEEVIAKLEEEVKELGDIKTEISQRSGVNTEKFTMEALNKGSMDKLKKYAFAYNQVKLKKEVPSTRRTVKATKRGFANVSESNSMPSVNEESVDGLLYGDTINQYNVDI